MMEKLEERYNTREMAYSGLQGLVVCSCQRNDDELQVKEGPDCFKEFKNNLSSPKSWVWWHKPIISALGRLRQEGHKCEANLGYMRTFCFKLLSLTHPNKKN